MSNGQLSWWKKKSNITAQWFWMKPDGTPFRMMFGAPPKTSTQGYRDSLAFFQMYSFSYIVNFKPWKFHNEEDMFITRHHNQFDDPFQPIGLQCGNPESYKIFKWNNHFTMSAYMVPVNYHYNPLPTRVYYRCITSKTRFYKLPAASDCKIILQSFPITKNTFKIFQNFKPTIS